MAAPRSPSSTPSTGLDRLRNAGLAAIVSCASALAAEPAPFTLTSPQLVNGERMSMTAVSNLWGHTGENLSPQLSWQGAPAGTKSYAVTVYDPDAPTGSGWWHWVVFNIPAHVQGLPLGAGSGKAPLPAGAIQSRTDLGKPGYLGAAPPPGPIHHYIFTVYALDTETLPLDADASPAFVGFTAREHVLGKASITVTYNR